MKRKPPFHLEPLIMPTRKDGAKEFSNIKYTSGKFEFPDVNKVLGETIEVEQP